MGPSSLSTLPPSTSSQACLLNKCPALQMPVQPLHSQAWSFWLFFLYQFWSLFLSTQTQVLGSLGCSLSSLSLLHLFWVITFLVPDSVTLYSGSQACISAQTSPLSSRTSHFYLNVRQASHPNILSVDVISSPSQTQGLGPSLI